MRLLRAVRGGHCAGRSYPSEKCGKGCPSVSTPDSNLRFAPFVSQNSAFDELTYPAAQKMLNLGMPWLPTKAWKCVALDQGLAVPGSTADRKCAAFVLMGDLFLSSQTRSLSSSSTAWIGVGSSRTQQYGL